MYYVAILLNCEMQFKFKIAMLLTATKFADD